MPKSLRAAGCVRKVAQKNTLTEHVWISDDLLFDVFRRFTCGQRRYGSSVPGPLEARRRAAKRKNTSFAHHDFSTPVLDPSVIFGSPKSNPGWQTVPTYASDIPSRLLPSWLLQPPATPLENVPARADTQEWLGSEGRLQVDDYTRQLQNCSELDSIRGLIKSLKLNLRNEPYLAKSALHRLTDLYWTHPTAFNPAVSEFLSDPELNPTGSQNHLWFLQQLDGKQMSRRSWDDYMLPAYQTAIGLGLVSADDLQQILLSLPQYLRSAGLECNLQNGLPLSDWNRFLTSIQACQVLAIKDLGIGFVTKWLHLLARNELTTNVTKLIWRLHIVVSFCDKELFDVLLLARLRHSGARGDLLRQELIDAVYDLPLAARGYAVFTTSQRLVAALLSGYLTSAELGCWHEVLTLLDSEMLGFGNIDQKAWNALYQGSISLTSAQNLAVLAWTISNISCVSSSDLKNFYSCGARNQFRSSYQREYSQNNGDILSQMVIELDQLPLPGKERMNQCLSSVLDVNMGSLMELKGYKEAVQKSVSGDLRIFDDDKFHQWAMQNSRHELARVAECVSEDLHTLSNMFQLLIMHDKKRLKIIRRVLENSITMKLRVSRWPASKSSLRSTGKRGTATASVKNNEAVEFVHHLALAIAVSPALGPRSAFRHVQYLYNWLQRYGAPILPRMSRALWHAGVSRYGKQGCPVSQLKWCLEKVEEIEGPEARAMLMEARHPRRWAAEMENVKSHLIETNAKTMRSIMAGRSYLHIASKSVDIGIDVDGGRISSIKR